ncbi:hypothetical protein N431DRAFT_560602 [Stipitochalara longipes BDJ]|nr:hypothetical protein N431DRAFT_560602 [Stipitochalara longipes BDJ]
MESPSELMFGSIDESLDRFGTTRSVIGKAPTVQEDRYGNTSPIPQHYLNPFDAAELTNVINMNDLTSLGLHRQSQILRFKHNTSQSELSFHNLERSQQRALEIQAHDLGLEYESSVTARILKISRLVPALAETPNSEADYDQSPRDEFLEIVFNESGRLTSFSPSTSTDSQRRSSQSNETPVSSISSTFNFSGGPDVSSKKKRNSYDDEDQRDAERPRKQGRTRPRNDSPKRGQRGRRLACHFHLSDKHKYCKNSVTGKKYETCSGPGWYTMHHVNKEKWREIERDVSRAAFQKLDPHFRNKVDHWVLENLDSYAPQDPIESRRGELRKWYLVWHILSPEVEPPSPCKFLYSQCNTISLQIIVYEEPQENIPSNTSLLIRTFKDVVETGVQNGEIDGITDESLEKLQKYLGVAIARATENMRDALDTDRSSQQLEDLIPAVTFDFSAFPTSPPWFETQYQRPQDLFLEGEDYTSASTITSVMAGAMAEECGGEASDPFLLLDDV